MRAWCVVLEKTNLGKSHVCNWESFVAWQIGEGHWKEALTFKREPVVGLPPGVPVCGFDRPAVLWGDTELPERGRSPLDGCQQPSRNARGGSHVPERSWHPSLKLDGDMGGCDFGPVASGTELREFERLSPAHTAGRWLRSDRHRTGC